MIYLAYLVFSFTVFQLLSVLLNFLFQQKALGVSNNHGLVSVLIPARNEEKNIENILKDLTTQDYQNIEVLVFDDQSTDATPTIVADLMKQDMRIRLLSSDGLPQGWLGKNYACHCLSEQAKGNFLLFLDADVRIANLAISAAVSTLKQQQLGLLSIFPTQQMKNLGEKLTVPLMNMILLTLLPLIFVRKSFFVAHAAANGQFMLFDADVYRRQLPHKHLRNKRVEDIEIARHFKRKKIDIACLLGNEDVTCRMYHSYHEALNGFSKNISMFFGNSYVLAFSFWLITTFGFIPVYLAYGMGWVLFVYLVVLFLIKALVSLLSRQVFCFNLMLMFLQQLVLGHLLFYSVYQHIHKNYQWKERNIS